MEAPGPAPGSSREEDESELGCLGRQDLGDSMETGWRERMDPPWEAHILDGGFLPCPSCVFSVCWTRWPMEMGREKSLMPPGCGVSSTLGGCGGD